MEFLMKIKGYVPNLSGKIGLAVSRESDKLNCTNKSKRASTVTYILVANSLGATRSPKSLEAGLGNLVCLLYFGIGIGILLPWNTFITAIDYFEYLYPNSHIDRIFTVSYLIPCLVSLALLISYGQHIDASIRMNCGLGLFFIGIVVVLVMEALFIKGQHGSFGTRFVTEVVVVLAGVGDGLVEGTLMGSANLLPPKYMQAILSSTGFSSVLASFLRIATKLAFPGTPSGLCASANTYFTINAFFLIFCVLSYNFVHRLTSTMPYIDGYGVEVVAEGLAIEGSSDLVLEKRGTSVVHMSDSEMAIFESHGGSHDLAASKVGQNSEGLAVEGSSDLVLEKRGASVICMSDSEKAIFEGHGGSHDLAAFKVGQNSAGEGVEKEDKSRLIEILFRVKWLAVAFTLSYVTTLAIFPGVLAKDVESAFFQDWYPILLITCFNVFDLVGRSLPTGYGPSNQILSFGWATARLLFFPLYAACVHGPPSLRTETPVFVLTALLGLTNGYLTTYFFLLGPKCVKSGVRNVQTAGVVMEMALEVGLTLGSLLSWVWVV